MINPPEDFTAREALAEAWAAIDGKLAEFTANRANRGMDHKIGAYPGYMEDARTMIAHLADRGFVVVRADSIGLGRVGKEVW